MDKPQYIHTLHTLIIDHLLQHLFIKFHDQLHVLAMFHHPHAMD